MTVTSHAATERVPGWEDLRHGGLLLDGQRLADLACHAPASPLDDWTERQLRRHHVGDDAQEFVKFVLEQVCGFDSTTGKWTRGTKVAPEWGRRAATGENVKPRALWQGIQDSRLPVFWEPGVRVGIGKGRRTVSRVLGWLRAGNDHLALVTNGKQWRLLFAGLDFEAWCEWDTGLWFEEGKPTPQVDALRTLLQPKLWTPASKGATPPLLQAIRDTRKGQAELSETLGERVREAVETLIQGHGEALKEQCADVDPADIYRAACRVAMRLVVVLFAESRDLLPRDNAVYHASYGLNGLLERLQKASGGRCSAWPQVLALFNLVRKGSHMPQLPVKDYGGELFERGSSDSEDGVSRALAVFETACLKRIEADVLPDSDVLRMLERMTRTKARIRQGRAGTWVTVPVDFSDLSSDYIGILYEGLLDYELKTASPDEPVIFLAAGQCPALPLSRLEAMDDKAVKTLFENLKKAKERAEGKPEELKELTADEGAGQVAEVDGPLFDKPAQNNIPDADRDERHASRTRAEKWAREAAQIAGLVKKPRGKLTPERRLKLEEESARTASKLVDRVVLPGEWYLVRWGGTRKGSGSFYTRPGLVVPTVRRTLLPLAYDPPTGKNGEPDRDAPVAKWTPKPPEKILELKVCDPACGSGAFVLSALRFLTDALLTSLQHHGRIESHGERTMVRLLGLPTEEVPTEDGQPAERITDEMVPCPPDHDDFEPRLKAALRRHVVERCIYAVDIDPLAVELCRLSLWIETMDRSLPFGFLDHKVKCGNSLVGAWLDRFAHYPVMAWKNREGGDQNHSNGIHFKKGARTKAIKAFVQETLKPDLVRFLGDPDLFSDDYRKRHAKVHAKALAVLEKMHALPVQDAAERAQIYRREFEGSAEWRLLVDAMDLWCACWFWPADEIALAPVPTDFADPPQETKETVRRIVAEIRFFHWELEFPDAFCDKGTGFDAVLGNPPWDVAKSNSQEFFSNIDPLYRSYGKQEAAREQTAYFGDSISGKALERKWIDYNARFRAQSNYVKYATRPFGDPAFAKEKNDLGRFSIERGAKNAQFHRRWRQARDTQSSTSFADASHPFRHQGSGDLNLYKLFLEASYSLLNPSGRLGFIVPAGLYSDYGTGALRRVFLEQCGWEWIFGIENRNKIFPIHRSYKFNPIIVQKSGSTNAIRTAFMRHNLDDWDNADDISTSYARSQVEQFSPESRALLEVQSGRDLAILEKIYGTSVLLGDEGPDGWGVEWTTEFHMTNDSKLFARRPKWEAEDYHPDEYSRWLRGKWRPIADLWSKLGVDPLRPVVGEHQLKKWLFDTTAGLERRRAEASLLRGHLLKPGDVIQTDWRTRCARPPYDRLPVPRASIPAGVILSRDGSEWISEDDISENALPLQQGIMIQPFVPAARGWISGTGLRATWDHKNLDNLCWDPQYLMSQEIADEADIAGWQAKIGYRRIVRSTDARSFIGATCPAFPCGDSVFLLYFGRHVGDFLTPATAILNSFVFDYSTRMRLAGTNLSWYVMAESALPRRDSRYTRRGIVALRQLGDALSCFATSLAPIRLLNFDRGSTCRDALLTGERMRLRAIVDALCCVLLGCNWTDMQHILRMCDLPVNALKRGSDIASLLDPRGFWRVDRSSHPELRHTVLALIAYNDLEAKIEAHDGNRDLGIEAFMTQNNGEGWLIPEILRLADYGLGHDERAKQPQPVASCLGPRFYDWQLVQTFEEAWQECHLHTRNLLGPAEYSRFLADVVARHGQNEDVDTHFLLNDYTRNLIGDNGLPGACVAQDQQAFMRAAEPRAGYNLFGTDGSS